jgi:hypothetical protein
MLPTPCWRQGDILRPLRLPALLVGDFALGGISTTLSAYESLLLRWASLPMWLADVPVLQACGAAEGLHAPGAVRCN